MDGITNFIELFPAYWIYNAGLVGIIRTLKRFDMKEGQDYKIENSALKITEAVWDKLISRYIVIMEEIFGKNWFYGKIAYQSNEGGIFTNNKLINGLKVPDLKFIDDKSKWIYEMNIKYKQDKQSKIGVWRFRQWITYVIGKLKKNEIVDIIEISELETKIKEDLKTFNKEKKGLTNLESQIYEWNDPVVKSFTMNVVRYLYNMNCESWESIWDENDNVKPEIIDSIKIALGKRLRQILIGKDGKHDIACSFCGNKEKNCDNFDMRWFSYEGGSTGGFNNFYWENSTQLPICGRCRLVIYFSPLGIFPGSDTRQGEFINIPDIESLWRLNNYRMEIFKTKKEEQYKMPGERSRLIDAIVSTGAYLQLKSRWLLQNIEIIEIGGAKKDTVYNLEIAPTSLRLLTDYSSSNIAGWLNSVEKIEIRKSQGKLYKGKYMYTNKYPGFANGKEIVERFLQGDSGWLIKISILLFKTYFEKERDNRNQQPLNNFSTLIEKSVKPLLSLILSHLKREETSSEFITAGKSFARFFNSRDEFEGTFLPAMFNSIYTFRRNDLIEIIMKIYIRNEEAIDDKYLELLKINDMEFQVEALLFIIGILENLHHKEE